MTIYMIKILKSGLQLILTIIALTYLVAVKVHDFKDDYEGENAFKQICKKMKKDEQDAFC